MPRLSVILLRGALACLLAGTLLGAVLLAGAPLTAALHPGWREAHLTLLVFGWLLPFVFGTAYWMLPRHPTGGGRSEAAGLVAGVYGAGLGLRLAGAVLALRWGLLAGVGLLVIGTGGFLVTLWGRVRPFGAGRAPP